MILRARLRIGLARGRSRVQIPAGPPHLKAIHLQLGIINYHGSLNRGDTG